VSANLALGYVAGALSTLSPCVLPILPIVLFGALERHLWGPVALAAGLAASFVGAGIALASVGFSTGIDAETLRLVVAALMGAAGVVLLVPALQGKVASMASPLAGRGQVLLDRLQPSGIWGQFALGAVLGVLWSPCSGDARRRDRSRDTGRRPGSGGLDHGGLRARRDDTDPSARLRFAPGDHGAAGLDDAGIAHRQASDGGRLLRPRIVRAHRPR
jgi:hypothetical protein